MLQLLGIAPVGGQLDEPRLTSAEWFRLRCPGRRRAACTRLIGGRSKSPQHGDVRPQAGERGAQLVAGVLHEALWSCSLAATASAPSIPLNAVPSCAASSVPSVGTSTSRRPVDATSDAASVRRSNRRVSWRPISQPTHRRSDERRSAPPRTCRRMASSEFCGRCCSATLRASMTAPPPKSDEVRQDAERLTVDRHVVPGLTAARPPRLLVAPSRGRPGAGHLGRKRACAVRAVDPLTVEESGRRPHGRPGNPAGRAPLPRPPRSWLPPQRTARERSDERAVQLGRRADATDARSRRSRS